jgi:hypothetical protein
MRGLLRTRMGRRNRPPILKHEARERSAV